jgi:hypothetical protein
MNWPAHGIHEGVAFSDYRSDDITQDDDLKSVIGKAVSKSLIVDFAADPSAWKNSPAKVATGAMKAGSLLDCLITTPEEMDERYVISEYKAFNSNESKTWKKEQESSGMEVIKQDQLDAAKAQHRAIMQHDAARSLLVGSRKQVAFRHKTKHGFDAKGLIDILPDDGKTIVDLKTCEPRALESERALQRHIYEWSYHIQAGGYCEGYSIASGEERFRFKFIFVTSKPPFRVAVINLPVSAILFGADKYREGMDKFAQCLESNTWPSIWDGEVELDLPGYAYPDERTEEDEE